MHVGYARVSTLEQDLSAQREALERLGVENKNIYFDHGLTGTTRARPGLREALAATRDGDTLVVTKLDRLARSLPDARDIADELTIKGVALSLGGSVYDPNSHLNVRQSLHNTPGIGARQGGRRRWGRNKRWEYWNVITQRHILAVTVSHVDYIALHSVWLLDRESGEVLQKLAIVPFGIGASLPGSLGSGNASGRAPGLQLQIEKLGDQGERVSVDGIEGFAEDVLNRW